MKYVNNMQKPMTADASAKLGRGCKDAATELYENMCMNAVNQSIGAFALVWLRTSYH